ncbi:MAG: response regulator transcription factor [Coriobacteriia bacterium]|nr:response regulator transcription factor [Coriobacteriia bacterium]
MTTVLIVDDEANIRELVSLYLTAAGFTVESAETGTEAVEKVRALSPDLVVLDIMLPGASGAEVTAQVREFSQVPIVMLTARDTAMDKVALLEAGADDYMVKPFSPPELVARVRAVLRRTDDGNDAKAGGTGPQARAGVQVVSIGGLSIDPEAREVSIDGCAVVLTAREFDLLLAMARRPGVVFSREQLLEAALGFSDYAEARGVDVHVRHLREKLGDDAATPRFIETVRGVGYRVRRDAK